MKEQQILPEPEPKAEIGIFQYSGASFVIYLMSTDAAVWMAEQAPKFGTYSEPGESMHGRNYATFTANPMFNLSEVIKYLASYDPNAIIPSKKWFTSIERQEKKSRRELASIEQDKGDDEFPEPPELEEFAETYGISPNVLTILLHKDDDDDDDKSSATPPTPEPEPVPDNE